METISFEHGLHLVRGCKLHDVTGWQVQGEDFVITLRPQRNIIIKAGSTQKIKALLQTLEHVEV